MNPLLWFAEFVGYNFIYVVLFQVGCVIFAFWYIHKHPPHSIGANADTENETEDWEKKKKNLKKWRKS